MNYATRNPVEPHHAQNRPVPNGKALIVCSIDIGSYLSWTKMPSL